MKGKIFAILFVISILLTASIALTSAKTITKTKSEALSKEVYLGYANVYGDGVEENTEIEVSAENNLIVKISENTEIIDFYIEYDLEAANGLNDNCGVSFLLQINGEQKGHNESRNTNKYTRKILHNLLCEEA